MRASAGRHPDDSRRTWPLIVLFALLLLLAWFGFLYHQIELQSLSDETRAADVIVVFGAAEYDGKPSPVYRARLDHGIELYKQGLAPMMITSGGAGGDPHFTEGQVGRDYLIAHGVPENKLIAETQSEDTAESARRVAAIMRENNMRSCLAVSDPQHMYRVKQMLRSVGVEVYCSPRPEARNLQPRMQVLLEALKYTYWKVLP